MAEVDFILKLTVAVFVLGAIAGLAVAVYKFNSAQKRAEERVMLAWSMGFDIDPVDFSIPRKYSGFSWLNQGTDQKAFNVMRGKVCGYDYKLFEYEYYIQSREGNHRYEFSAVIIDTDSVFPSLVIRPEQFKDKLADAAGFGDIDFESQEFSNRFYVKSCDKKFAYDLLHPRMMEFLLMNPWWSLHLLGTSIMLYNGRTFRPEELKSSIKFLSDFLMLVPEYLWQNVGAKRRPTDVQQ